MRHSRIIKGKTIKNKHTRSIMAREAIRKDSSVIFNISQKSSKYTKKEKSATNDMQSPVQSPLSSCRSSPVKLQNKQMDPESGMVVHQTPSFSQPPSALIEYQNAQMVSAFPEAFFVAATDASATQAVSKESSLNIDRLQARHPLNVVTDATSMIAQSVALADGSRSQNHFVLSSR